MKYPKSVTYDFKLVQQKMMGPNPIKLLEELLSDCHIHEGELVMDLGSGQGLTSVFLARENAFRVVAVDLWTEPEDNARFFATFGFSSDELTAVKADALALPFEHESFDAIVSIDAFHYFARDAKTIEEKIIPYVKKGGYIYIAIPGFVQNIDHVPEIFRLNWSEIELETIRDISYWKNIIHQVKGIKIISINEMATNREAWDDWLGCQNEFAVSDRLIFKTVADNI